MKSLEQTWSDLATAFSKRTLSLLGNPHAHFYIALFEAIFDSPTSSVAYDELCARINMVVSEFAEDEERAQLCPQEDGAPKGAEPILRSLVDEYRWIEKSVMSDGSVMCRLTGDATEAISIVKRLNKRETLMSGSRMASVIDAVDRAKVSLSNDYESGLALLEERKEKLQREYDEYVATHGASGTDVSGVREVVYNLYDLILPLAPDIEHYESSLRAINVDFRRAVAQGSGEGGRLTRRHYDKMVDESLGRYRDSYRDAVRVKASYEQGDALFDSLRDIDLAATEGTEEPLPSLGSTWRDVTESIRRVTEEETRSSTLVSNALDRMMARDRRELTTKLTQLERATLAWASSVPARGETEFVGPLSRFSVGSLVTELGAPIADMRPSELVPAEVSDSGIDPARVRAFEAPRTMRILRKLREATIGGKAVEEAFNELLPEDRRVCELLGLLEHAAHDGSELVADGDVVEWHLVGEDGSEVTWMSRGIRMRGDGEGKG